MGGPRFTEELRGQYVALLRAGVGRHAAARSLGVGVRTVQDWRKQDEAFREACEDAEAEVTEPVELMLYEAAKRGEAWAVKMWLTNRDKHRWQPENKVQVEVSGQVEHKVSAAELVNDVRQLAAELERRRSQMALSAGDDVVDVEVVD